MKACPALILIQDDLVLIVSILQFYQSYKCLMSTSYLGTHISNEIFMKHPTYSTFKLTIQYLPEEEGRASVNSLVLLDFLLS